MKKLLVAAAIAALGTSASAQSLVVPQPEVTQSAPGFMAGDSFGALGGAGIIITSLAVLTVIAVIASDDDDNSNTTLFQGN